MASLKVIDFFCGAGGFSEGFRQQGCKIVAGYDNWKPAIDTFNFNFGKGKGKLRNILDFEKSDELIEGLPNTDIILGSPPCVTFSSSNISGKADKTSGIKLTLIFLRIVAVKKWQKGSKLKAWFMENVPSSIKHLGSEYTFEELGLGNWAKKNKIGRSKVAIRLDGNQQVINSADYGSPQSRERVISGEIIKRKKLIIPEQTHSENVPVKSSLKPWVTLRQVKGKLPKPICTKSSRLVRDPNYPWLSIKLSAITDHFYDTGLYSSEWKQSQFLKTNHPYMGRMSFPENENRPSRTITATKIGTSREAILYRSDTKRLGHGEFRTPTVREAACIMGFPITYQFVGSESTKWRLVGNAVCPAIGRAFAKHLRQDIKFKAISRPIIRLVPKLVMDNNLNCFTLKKFESPPKRVLGSKFRRHPFKDGNITVTLSNYYIENSERKTKKWITSVQYGNGEGFPTYNFPDGYYKSVEQIIKNTPTGPQFLNLINNGFMSKIADRKTLQRLYENNLAEKGHLAPTTLIEKLSLIIEDLKIDKDVFVQNEIVVFENKEEIPLKQLLALYAINKITTIANKLR